MSAFPVTQPFPVFFDTDGQPLEDGYIYIGVPYLDPQTNPQVAYWDSALTIPVQQPIRTINGYAALNGTPAVVYVTEDYSMRVTNKNNAFIYSFESASAPTIPGSFTVDRFTANGVQTSFALSTSPGSILNTQVYINGVYQNKNTYTVNGTNLLFSVAPPNTSVVEVVMLTTFQVGVATADAYSTTYNLGAAGAVDTNVGAKLNETVSVKDFGAVGDGVTDDTAAIQAALTASTGKTLKFVFGTYKVTSTLTLQSNSALVFDPSTTIDFSSGGTSDYLFFGQGTIGSAISLTANASVGDEFITVSDASGFSVDDEILIRSEATWNSVSPKSGEIHYVASIVGNVIGLRDVLYDNYTTANSAAVQKITPIKNISLNGGEFIGGGAAPTTTQKFLGLLYGDTIDIQGVKVDGFGIQNIELESTVKINLRNSDLGYIRQASDNSYAITLFNACQWVTIANNHFALSRAGVSSGGRAAQYGYVRNVSIVNNTFYGILGGAVRAQVGSENWTITGNTIQAGEATIRSENEGILFRGLSCAISGNSINNVDGTAIRCIAQAVNAPRPSSYTISGNVMVRCGRSGVIVTSDPTFAGAEIKGVSISSNVVTEWAHRAATPAYDINSQGGDVANVSVVGNTCAAPAQSARACLIRSFINEIKNGAICGNTFDNTSSTAETVLLTQDSGGVCGGFAINGNRAYGGTYGIRQSGTSVSNYVAGNVVSGSAGGLLGFSAPETGGNITV